MSSSDQSSSRLENQGARKSHEGLDAGGAGSDTKRAAVVLGDCITMNTANTEQQRDVNNEHVVLSSQESMSSQLTYYVQLMNQLVEVEQKRTTVADVATRGIYDRTAETLQCAATKVEASIKDGKIWHRTKD